MLSESGLGPNVAIFLGIADPLRRKGTLTETQRLSDSLMRTAVLMSLLTLILLAMLAPAYELFGIHPISPVIVIGGILGFRAIYSERRAPAWPATEDGATSLAEAVTALAAVRQERVGLVVILWF